MNKPKGHPEAETLAAFVDGRLTGSERERLQQHLLACEDCTIVFAETSRLPVPWPATSSRPRWRMLAAAAIVLVSLSGWIGVSLWRARSTAPGAILETLAAAAGPERPAEGRLSAFAYGPPPRIPRSGEAGKPTGPRSSDLTAAAARIERLASEDPSPEHLHALGLAHLAIGDIDDAVTALERALAASPREPRISSDLAAALIERGRRQRRPEDLARALSVAEAALEGAPTQPDARFNRALALEKLHLRERAIWAWERYLEIDPGSAWAAEAREHLARLREPTGAELWPHEREALVAAAELGDITTVREITERNRQAVREWIRDGALARWGAEVREGDRTAAGRTLAAAEIVSHVHSDLAGDPMTSEMVACARSAFVAGPRSAAARALADAHVALAQARRDIEGFRIDEARPLLVRARAGFDAAGSPAVLWVDHALAVVAYYQGDSDEALRLLETVRVEADRRGYQALLGHVHWIEGLILAVRSRLSDALAHYRRAQAAFERVGDAGWTACVQSLCAEDLRYLGDRSEEWRQRGAALSGIGHVASRQRVEGMLMEAGIATLEEGLPRAALHFHEESLESAVGRSDAVQAANALQWRALAHFHLGLATETDADLTLARSWTRRIDDASLRRRLESELDYAAGLAASLGDPGAARSELTRAIEYFRASGNDLRLSELYLARGRCCVRAGDENEAAADFRTGIETFERQRLAVVPDPLRVTFFDTATDLFDEEIGLSARRGRTAEAFGYAERCRARQLLESLPGPAATLDVEQIRARIPEGTALVLYAVLPDRLLKWVVTSDGVGFVVSPIDTEALDRLVTELRETIQDPARAGQAREAAIRLHDILIKPEAGRLAGMRTLVVVADKSLHALPFAALVDRETGRFLLETHEIIMAPSATLFVRSLAANAAAGSGSPVLLAVGDPSFDETTYPYLPRLEGAEEEAARIAAFYPSFLVLSGDSATKAAFLEAAARSEIIHYAGHALSNEANPLRSRFVLASDPNNGDDGTLFCEDLYGRRFPRTRLVVLAACSTASGLISRGEGAMSLARPFLAGGVPAVVATLWDVEDRGGRELSVRLHRHLAAGAAPSEALRQAQLEMLELRDPAMRSPGIWAAFELIGGRSS